MPLCSPANWAWLFSPGVATCWWWTGWTSFAISPWDPNSSLRMPSASSAVAWRQCLGGSISRAKGEAKAKAGLEYRTVYTLRDDVGDARHGLCRRPKPLRIRKYLWHTVLP
ncbi:hypothetical protein BD289DRAFT_288907 [Coniella lustricola]|uniref:Uncharacterized protein n=1 Tax=Coniella lustricola TaxID=2025994 RepID=A0A2T3A5L4_9PEZI|nr:hypothetical protein BD289DRAFT_288907 [Coniella lustricola]